jgi:peptidoglycan/LPS O-acetylase OafA/YrhL
MSGLAAPNTPADPDPGAPVSAAQTPKGFRRDIQGLRGLALVAVLLCHARVPFAEGGFVALDVFFVMSGFLITGLMLKELDRTGSLSVLRFYARRARRLLPLAMTVLAAIAVGSLILFATVRSEEVAGDVIAAALYVVNWRFMAQAVDYFAFESPDVSPVQHYWSLSVEEQFYIVWPVLFLGAIALARRSGWSAKALLWGIVAPVGLASLGYGIWFSAVEPGLAYFSSATRIWEIALGCALALVLPAGIRLPKPLVTLTVVGGLAVLVLSCALFAETDPYPGWRALLPCLATAAIIVAGTATVRTWPVRVLATEPLQRLGKISYAWYLWHWPALVFAAAIAGRPLTMAESLAVTAASWVPTIVTHHLIEERFRHSRTLARHPRRALALGVTCTATAVALGVGLATVQPTIPTASADEAPGAREATKPPIVQPTADAVRPNPREAEDDRGDAFFDDCHLKGSRLLESPACVYGDERSETTVVLVGDSHGLQYFPAMQRIAERRGWRLVSLTRAGCTTADVAFEERCDAWRENTLRRIERERPALVVVSNGTNDRYGVVGADGERLSREASQPLLEDGFERTLRRLRGTGAKVAVIRDQVRVRHDVVDCVAEHLDDLAACASPAERRDDLAFDAAAARRVDGVKLIDPLAVLCPEGTCPAVIGNVVVYRNDYHLSATYAASMADWLAERLPDV